MAQHRSTRSPAGVATNARHTWKASEAGPDPSEITDIIPFNEFGDLADLDFRENSAFDRESQVIQAPELDDLHDTDDLIPLRLAVPSEFRPDPRAERRASHAYRDSHTDTSDGVAATDIIDISGRRGLHRKQDVPVKGRLMVAAMAAGADRGRRLLDGQRLRQGARGHRAGRRPVRDGRRGRHRLRGRHADRLRHPGGRCVGARRGARQGRRLRPGACRA